MRYGILGIQIWTNQFYGRHKMRLQCIVNVVLIICLTAVNSYAANIIFDAAEKDRMGIVLADPHVRMKADNRTGTLDMTNVLFHVDIHSGTLGNVYLVTWDDAANPWYGARAKQQWAVTQDEIKYSIGRVYYPDNAYNQGLGRAGCWAPYFGCERLPGNSAYQEPPEGLEGIELEMWNYDHNCYELFNTVPIGLDWDMTLRLEGWMGSEIELFSVAGGELRSDQSTWTLSDADDTPQTVPEPGIISILCIGTALTLWRRQSRYSR